LQSHYLFADKFGRPAKRVRLADDLQTGSGVDRRFQAHPGKDASFMKRAQCGDSITGQRGATLPFSRERIIQAGER
jgi:hypothetical protein